MGDSKFTFLELHLHDGTIQFGPRTIDFAGDSEGEAEEEEGDAALELGEDIGTSGGPPKGVLALLALVALAAIAWKLFGSNDLEDLEELEDLAEEL